MTKKIKITDLPAKKAKGVKGGGGIFIKLDGMKGESTHKLSSTRLDFLKIK